MIDHSEVMGESVGIAKPNRVLKRGHMDRKKYQIKWSRNVWFLRKVRRQQHKRPRAVKIRQNCLKLN